MGARPARAVPVFGDLTRKKLELSTTAIDAGHFHSVSSIAVVCLYEGLLCEDMFDEAENFQHPYFMIQHESEKIARAQCRLPWSLYRPALVVGDSTTG